MASQGKQPPSRPERQSILLELKTIKAATRKYLDTSREDRDWVEVESNFRDVAASPERILAVVHALEQFQQLPSPEEMSALGRLIQDLTGYIKMTAGDKPDPVRDDLLLQARKLLDSTGL